MNQKWPGQPPPTKEQLLLDKIEYLTKENERLTAELEKVKAEAAHYKGCIEAIVKFKIAIGWR